MNQEHRTIRFTLQDLDENNSLISGVDITNDLKRSSTDFSKNSMLDEVFRQAPCLAAVTLGEDFKFIFANTLYKKLVGDRIAINATHSTQSKNVVLITIEDNGRGIEDSKLSKIFDPFYTFKRDRKSTGLGLALCQK